MNKEPLMFMGVVALVGYAVFHGHRVGIDCWLCQYRGITFGASALLLGIWLAHQENG